MTPEIRHTEEVLFARDVARLLLHFELFLAHVVNHKLTVELIFFSELVEQETLIPSFGWQGKRATFKHA